MPALTLPTIEAIDAAASSLSVTANPAERRALIKAQYNLHRGLEIVAVQGALLIPSATSDAIYEINSAGECSCPASGLCWHQMTERIIIEAQSRPTMPRLTNYRKALAEINELF